uniref:Zinc finger, CCHC-type, retrotransposon Gag domain protein n=1 Tax=Tanacetum cinerariifolium TaxID=118510 RepID=A0A699JDF8_TANCI|nr:zinc finger, CCHC-type, retrotransposon Gag domain protein [Tanacetum cinerariifolium]
MQRFLRLAGFLGAAAGTEEEQAKNFQWGLRRSTLNHLMCMSYMDVAYIANAARNYEILHERDDDDTERPYKRQRSGDRHQPTFQQSSQGATVIITTVMDLTSVVVANAARNYEILHEMDDDDVEQPDKRQKSGDRHQPTTQQSSHRNHDYNNDRHGSDRRGGGDNHRSNNNYSGNNNSPRVTLRATPTRSALRVDADTQENVIELLANLYHDFEIENPHTHTNNFKRITLTLKFRDMLNDVIKLMMFPYSLEGNARVWYDKEPPNSILTWSDLVTKFVNQLFPPSITTHLKNESLVSRKDSRRHLERHENDLRKCLERKDYAENAKNQSKTRQYQHKIESQQQKLDQQAIFSNNQAMKLQKTKIQSPGTFLAN